MKLILNFLILSILNYCVYSQQYSKFHITGPGCSSNGENINLNQCAKSMCGGSGTNIVYNTQSNYTINLFYDNLCADSSDSMEFECPDDQSSVEIGSYYLSCHDSTWVPVNYNQFTIYGEGCNSNGETLDLNICTDVCGSFTSIKKDILTGEYNINLAYDAQCSQISDQMEFACLPNNEAVKIGDYGLICNDPTSASSESTDSSTDVAEYTNFVVFGPGCPASGDQLSIYQCNDFCGSYGQFSLNDTLSNTYNVAMSSDSTCNYITDEAQIICLSGNQYVAVGDYYIVCQN